MCGFLWVGAFAQGRRDAEANPDALISDDLAAHPGARNRSPPVLLFSAFLVERPPVLVIEGIDIFLFACRRAGKGTGSGRWLQRGTTCIECLENDLQVVLVFLFQPMIWKPAVRRADGPDSPAEADRCGCQTALSLLDRVDDRLGHRERSPSFSTAGRRGGCREDARSASHGKKAGHPSAGVRT